MYVQEPRRSPARGSLRNRVREARERDRQQREADALARVMNITDEVSNRDCIALCCSSHYLQNAGTYLHAVSRDGRADLVEEALPIWANVNVQDNVSPPCTVHLSVLILCSTSME